MRRGAAQALGEGCSGVYARGRAQGRLQLRRTLACVARVSEDLLIVSHFPLFRASIENVPAQTEFIVGVRVVQDLVYQILVKKEDLVKTMSSSCPRL